MGDSQFIASASHPEIQLQTGGTPHKIQFTALPYVSYDVLYSEDLLDWEVLTHINATTQAAAHTVPEPVAGRPKAFFNLKPR